MATINPETAPTKTLTILYRDFIAGNVRRDVGECTFTLFPELPPEVRDEIWEYALPDPQIIKLSVDGGARELTFKAEIGLNFGLLVMSQVKKEARKIALQHYSPLFGEIRNSPTYFSNERDIVCMCASLSRWFD